MKPSFSKKSALTLFFLAYVLILVIIFIRQINSGYAKESWNISELLINYQGGFVRRGLLGEFFYSLHQWFGISPYIAIIVFCATAYLALIAFFVLLFSKKKQSLFLLPFVFVLGNPIMNNFWVRKDVFLILLFILTLFSYLRINKQILRIIVVNFLLMVGILIHEGFAFICLPILLLLSASDTHQAKSPVARWARTFTLLLPSLVTFFATFVAKGSYASAQAIWNSWKSITFPLQEAQSNLAPSAIDALSWSLRKGISFSYNIFTNFDNGFYAPLLWAMVFILIYYIITKASSLNYPLFRQKTVDPINRELMSNSMMLQLIAVLPLLILGWDWGRWIFYWVVSSLAIYFLVPEEKLKASLPQPISTISLKLNTCLDGMLGRCNLLFLALLVGFPQYSWVLVTSIQHSAAGTLLKSFSTVIEQLLNFT